MPVLTRKRRITLVLIIVAAFFWWAHATKRNLLRQQAEQRVPSPPLASGMPMAPDLVLESLDGKKAAFGDFRGKVVLINFWASWCSPCIHEMPGLFAMQKELKNKGLVVLGINMDDNSAAGVAILHKFAGESPFTMFKGMNAPIADRFSIEGLPFTVLVDKNFNIVYAKAGEIDWDSPHAKALVGSLL
jgi:thiol-disulfide isomerase/thioredoxin